MNHTQQMPMVSVWMITYNHEPFIAQAIESVLMQKTTFPIELVIGEDCSTDGTATIVKEYANKYPQIIKARCNQPNLGMISNMIKTLDECTGKYIALCEGDDYWTDETKLQKQVDFLEENEEYVMCFHNVYRDFYGEKTLFNDEFRKVSFSIQDLFSPWFIPTGSIVFKNIIRSLPNWICHTKNGDLALLFNIAKHGKIKLIDGIMGVYRIHENGVSRQFNQASLISNIMFIFKNIEIETNGIYNSQMEEGINKLIELTYKQRIIKDEFFNNEKIKKISQYFTFKELVFTLLLKLKNKLSFSK